MEFDEINTLFHEFGHCFHAVMSKTELEGLAATDVFWDFVEVPSQFFENFSYDFNIMKKLAVDKEGNSIPDELLQKNLKRKTYLNSTYVMG